MKILFQGDSITDGNRYKEKSQEWDKNHQIGHSYVYTIVSLLGMMYPEKRYEFINRGISGNRTDHLLERWKNDTLALNPDVLCLLCGVNDSFHPMEEEMNCPDAGSVLERYEALLKRAKEANPELRLILLEPFYGEPNRENLRVSMAVGLARLQGIQKGVKELAERYDAIFVPLQQAFEQAARIREMAYWIWDGIHPTEAGHGLIAREFLDYTKGLFGLEFPAN